MAKRSKKPEDDGGSYKSERFGYEHFPHHEIEKTADNEYRPEELDWVGEYIEGGDPDFSRRFIQSIEDHYSGEPGPEIAQLWKVDTYIDGGKTLLESVKLPEKTSAEFHYEMQLGVLDRNNDRVVMYKYKRRTGEGYMFHDVIKVEIMSPQGPIRVRGRHPKSWKQALAYKDHESKQRKGHREFLKKLDAGELDWQKDAERRRQERYLEGEE